MGRTPSAGWLQSTGHPPPSDLRDAGGIVSRCYGSSWSPDIIAWELCSAVHSVPTPQIHICLEYQSVTHRIRVLKRHPRGETWTQRWEGGGRQPRDGLLEPPGSWKRQGGPSPGASAGSPDLEHPDLRRVVPRTRGGWIPAWGVKLLIYRTLTAALGDPRSLRF